MIPLPPRSTHFPYTSLFRSQPAAGGAGHRRDVCFPPARCDPPWHTAQSWDSGHGRREVRRLTVTVATPGFPAWPGARQVFRIERQRIFIRTGKIEEEIVYGVTSLRTDQVSAARLLQVLRQHWHI